MRTSSPYHSAPHWVRCPLTSRPAARGASGLVAALLLLGGLVAAPAARADSTGELNAGASTGGFTNAANALACDTAVASATSNNATQTFTTYGLSLPGTAIVQGIQVRVRANDGTSNNRKLRLSLSWDGGSTFTAPLATRNFRRNTALRDYVVGGSSVLWGRTWTASEFSNANFRVRALAPKGSGASPVNLDCIPVTVFYRLPGAPSLNLSKTDGPDPVQPGQNITYTISYSNTGESIANNVVISDLVPTNTTFVSASPAPLSAPAVGGTGTVTWNLASLAPGGSGFVTLVVKTGAALPNNTLITNATYSIDSDETLATAGNAVTTTVSGTVALTLSKTDSPDPVAPGGTLTYLLTIGNGGTGTATNINVNEAFDGNVVYTSSNATPGWTSTCAGISETIADTLWTIPSLTAGASCTITITTTVTSPLSDGVLLFNTADIIDDANSTAEASAVTTVVNPVVCGDSVVGGGEACDLGSGVNGSPGACCTAACQLRAGGETCRVAAGVCDTAETCSGASPTCPADGKSAAACRAAAGVCDVAETCDGVSNDCPADQFVAGGTECRPSVGICDPAESCTGTGAACPADAKSSAVCRGSAGACDPAESCDGVADDCPADAKSTALCRAAAGACDVAESCDGVNDSCPADAKSTALCRASAGVCDVAESCDGIADACPADAKSSAECRAASDACDVAESCDGVTDACPTDDVLPNGTSCRPSAGVCDAAETCDGAAKACPGDAKSTATCRAAAGVCDIAEACDGVGDDCPSDGFEPATTVCRASSVGEVCDVPESCTGAGASCPADAVQPDTTVCRNAAGTCDVADTCDGTNKTCPADAVAAPSTVCRPTGIGEVCDVAETCDGVGVTCPADGVLPSGSTCRASAGACDAAEACDGATKFCPADAKSTATCRAAAGLCDVAEVCDGSSDDCPADAFAPPTTVCRAATSGEVCDIPESCSGSSAACPTDAVLPNTTVCRSATGACDVAESCDGTTKTCPADGVASSSTACRPVNPGDVCDAAETCDGATKNCPADAVLPNGTSCRTSAGVCDLAEACNGVSKTCPADAKSTAVCRPAAGVCDVAESCDGASNTCPSNGFVPNGTNCDDSNYCNGTQACSAGVCGGGTTPCPIGQSCDEANDSCFAGLCPATPSVCSTAAKNKVLIKNNGDNGKDKFIWKWGKGAETAQADFADPTAASNYAVCVYTGGTLTSSEGAEIPAAGGKWSALSTKGYKYTDPTGANDGIQKIILKGGAAGKAKVLVKGKGSGLPDFDSDLPVDNGDLPVIVQLRNAANGKCWGSAFSNPKKNLGSQFSAKTP